VQLRGVIFTNHTPSRLRSGASSCAVTDCAVTGTTEIISMTTVMMIPHFMFLSVVLFIVLSPRWFVQRVRSGTPKKKKEVLLFSAMPHYNATSVS
jgi:hypothetical protein